MFLPKDIRCVICMKIFCCSNCRKRHQHLEHMEKINKNNLNLNCPICNGMDTIILHKINIFSEKLLEHMLLEHLPMQCKKCFKIFDNKLNFNDENSTRCQIDVPTKNSSVESPEAVLETIPEIEVNNNKVTLQNPVPRVVDIQQIQLSVDSASLRNFSSIMKIDQLTDISANHTKSSTDQLTDHTKSPAIKLVRTTSTPMQATVVIDLNSKDTSDSSSGGHIMMISSINQQTPETFSSSEHDSVGLQNSNNSSSFVMKKPCISTYPARNKILMAATPLRQIMSKSIQRAIQQHGIKSFNEIREYSSRHSESSVPSPRVEALDLRTTPVIRRSEWNYASVAMSENVRGIHSASTETLNNLTTISSTNSSNNSSSVYETCKVMKSMEINYDSLMTPKNSQNQGVMLKKTISFTTSACVNTPNIGKPSSSDDSESDIWFTPSTVLTRSQSCSILDQRRKSIDEFDEVFNDEPAQNIKKKSGLWSLVTKTVNRIKSFGGGSLTNHVIDSNKESSQPQSNNNSENHEPPYKKRRKISQYNSGIPTSLSTDIVKDNGIADGTPPLITSNEPRRRKIQCRPAISRMRK